MKKYSILVLSLILVLKLHAQETEKYSKNESVGQQLMKNKVPGLKYAPESPQATPQVQPHATMVEEIKNGKYGKVKTGGVSAPASSVPARNATVKLSSDQSSTQSAASSKKAAVPAVIIPTQGDVSEGALEAQPATSGGKNVLPVKKD